MKNLLWIIHDIGHNHQARIAALSNSPEVNLTVVTIYQQSGFEEFAGSVSSCGSARIIRMGFGRKKKRGDVAAFQTAVSRIVDEYNVQAILIPGWSEWFALLALKLAWSRGIGTVIFSESSFLSSRKVWLRERVKKKLLDGIGAAVVSGSEQITYLETLGVSSENIFAGYSAIDNDYFSREADIARQDPAFWKRALKLPAMYLVFSGRLVKEKNLFCLLDAFYAIKNDSRKAIYPDLVVMGDGPLRHELELYCLEKQLQGCVHFVGYQPYEMLPKVYGLSLGLILPSTLEPWGLVVNEALASKVPVLVSEKCGCAKDLVKNGVNGFVFDPLKHQTLSDILHQMSQDSSLGERMGVEGQKIISRWNVNLFSDSVKKAVALALDGPKKNSMSAFRELLCTMAAHR